MLPAHTWLGVATVKLRSSRSRLSAIGRSCHLSIVVMQKWRLPRARMPYRCITSAPAACLHRCPESAVAAISSAVGRRPDPPHKRRSYAPAAPRCLRWLRSRIFWGRTKCPRRTDTLTRRTRHCTLTGHTRRLRQIKEYFIFWPFAKYAVAFPLFLRCRAPS